MAFWNPLRGCHRYSEGCKYCFIHKGDAKRGTDTDNVVKLAGFSAPIAVNKKGEYALKSGQLVYTCFSTDFLLDDADMWRDECWRMIKQRPDLHFLFLTKRIERFEKCAPKDWGEGYDNVTIGCTVENEEIAEKRLGVFTKLPIKHKNIVIQPMLEEINIEPYLENIELVVVGGEYDRNARPFNYNWVLSVREQCVKHNVSFSLRQLGSNFIKDGKLHKLNYGMLFKYAKELNLDYHATL